MKRLLLSALLLCALSACGDKNAGTPAPAVSAPAAAASTTGNIPDVGRVEHVAVTTKGVGMTPGAAVNEALKSAVMQVNGVAVDASSANLNVIAQATAQVDVYSDQGHDSAKATAQLQGQAFAEQIITQSSGLVSSFKVLNVTAPDKKGGSYTVDIEAKIAKFKAPADAGKIKIVVAPLRSKQGSFNIGGRAVPAGQVLEPLQRQIIDALAQTGRFTVLDRQFDDEIQNELEMIGSGQTVNTDIAKLGQALSADLIWIGEINSLAYERHARQLQTSDRELVSYSGGWSVSQRMVNVATRQIQQSSTLQGSAPSIAPTTLGSGIDANKTLADMQADIVKKAVEAILLRSFPISIVERNGNEVVLSQGGAALKEKSRYRVYLLGKELKDPQTGQSLGNMEYDCCELVIKRVTPNVSYATLENVQVKLDGIQAGALQIREALAASTAKAADDVAAAIAPAGQKAAPARAGKAAAGSTEAPAAKAKEKDDW
ncbi:CsgG/HfaB family protein [Uliginosibacterium sp. 31-16]|uniref:CsgG/HfaB family protein n=1 Tax=Uliginosibacterium sp. 31-16 TaxID=3068315 RepID=UPI00273E8222|nr:CsgG/HfaB family protein [Uliginosibacterium sp. 31-16]MDP5240274.1 CsgG/HfaB family protein [Uliginosibacterium sp. 31-16]